MVTRESSLILRGYPPSLLLNLARRSFGDILTMEGCCMRDLYQEIIDFLAKCQDHTGLESFRDWFAPIALGGEEGADESLLDLIHEIQGILAESSAASWPEADLVYELQKIAHIWTRPQSIPTSPLPRSSGSLGSNATEWVDTFTISAA